MTGPGLAWAVEPAGFALATRSPAASRGRRDPERQEASIARSADPPAPRTRAALLLAFAALVALRLPLAWAHGRFLGEEGTIFFAYAWRRPALDALFRSFGGYLNLGANAATLLDARAVRAGWWPLEAAPYVTMLVALAVQCVPAALLVGGRAPWLNARWARPAALLAVAAAPMTEEVFLNTLHIQFHLALAAGLVLALDVPATRRARIAFNAILLLAPLCGPGAIVLMPLFGLRVFLDRSTGRPMQAAALAIGATVQLALFFHVSPVRGRPPSIGVTISVLFVRTLALPFLTRWGANVIGAAAFHSWSAGGAGWLITSVLGLVSLGTLTVLSLLNLRRGAAWLALAAILFAIAEFGGGMVAGDPSVLWNVGTGERYDFLPDILLLLALIAVANAAASAGRTTRVLLALAAISGAASYALPIAAIGDGPDWSREVAIWRADHRHLLRSWPATWLVDLSDNNAPCSPPGRPGVPSHDPLFCESAWIAGFAMAPRPTSTGDRPGRTKTSTTSGLRR